MQKSNSKWYLLLDREPLEGSWNMAVDDYLFRTLEEKPLTYVRFYRWERPTISLGYSQKVSRVVNLPYCQQNGVDIVRRLTGGKLVLHNKEVTYSVCSSDGDTFTSTLKGSYKRISKALMEGLKRMSLDPYLADAPPVSYVRGTMPCFSYPARDEIEIQGKKMIGSAQKRLGPKFVQHGSIPLQEEEELLRSVTFLEERKDVVRVISISRALGKTVRFDWAVDHFIKGFEDYFGIQLEPKEFNEEEKERIRQIQRDRYENDDWTYGK
ncbi:lipoate--protein ligase family protein [bacterium]|nr:lipoate--protein ligase family protein [bacterium]